VASRVPVSPMNSLTLNEAASLEYASGVTALALKDARQALHHFEQAESLGHDPELCGSHRWKCWMLLGDFESAWKESDLITARGTPDPNALWDGLSPAGRRVVIRCLHGYGDAIQFLRYARLLRNCAANVTVQAHPKMLTLIARIPGADSVVGWNNPSALPGGDWNQQMEVTELPRIFRTTTATIPREIPYVHLSPHALSESAERLGNSRTPRVGLLWAASAWNPARSMSLAELMPLLHAVNCSFYSFQRGPQRAELSTLSGGFQIHDTAVHSDDIADTAADLMNMDLFVTVDTMAAHLAGALGRPVWVMLPWDADWRWMLDREDTPWYPTMRLFRQRSPGDWKSVVMRIAAELSNLCV
jgi:hypothetical protein